MEYKESLDSFFLSLLVLLLQFTESDMSEGWAMITQAGQRTYMHENISRWIAAIKTQCVFSLASS